MPNHLTSTYWEARPLRMEQYYHVVRVQGTWGLNWGPEFVFDRVDDGAFRVKFHSDHDGLLLVIATGTEDQPHVHPYTLVIDKDGESYITHMGRTLAHVQGARFPKRQPAWVWVRFLHGVVMVGFGRDLGENEFMRGDSGGDAFGGGYVRFAVGKTGNNGAFEALDVQPLQRR